MLTLQLIVLAVVTAGPSAMPTPHIYQEDDIHLLKVKDRETIETALAAIDDAYEVRPYVYVVPHLDNQTPYSFGHQWLVNRMEKDGRQNGALILVVAGDTVGNAYVFVEGPIVEYIPKNVRVSDEVVLAIRPAYFDGHYADALLAGIATLSDRLKDARTEQVAMQIAARRTLYALVILGVLLAVLGIGFALIRIDRVRHERRMDSVEDDALADVLAAHPKLIEAFDDMMSKDGDRIKEYAGFSSTTQLALERAQNIKNDFDALLAPLANDRDRNACTRAIARFAQIRMNELRQHLGHLETCGRVFASLARQPSGETPTTTLLSPTQPSAPSQSALSDSGPAIALNPFDTIDNQIGREIDRQRQLANDADPLAGSSPFSDAYPITGGSAMEVPVVELPSFGGNVDYVDVARKALTLLSGMCDRPTPRESILEQASIVVATLHQCGDAYKRMKGGKDAAQAMPEAARRFQAALDAFAKATEGLADLIDPNSTIAVKFSLEVRHLLDRRLPPDPDAEPVHATNGASAT